MCSSHWLNIRQTAVPSPLSFPSSPLPRLILFSHNSQTDTHTDCVTFEIPFPNLVLTVQHVSAGQAEDEDEREEEGSDGDSEADEGVPPLPQVLGALPALALLR